MNWRLAYAIGFHPWEDTDPPFAATLSELLDREEKRREVPYGPALDLGTGSGIWGIQLARRGWQVTGIDIVEKALRRASDRVRQAGVEMRLVHGDVTALRAAGIGSDFRLVLDTGTFHDRPSGGYGPGGQRHHRIRRNRAAACVAEAQATADTGRRP